MRNARWVVLATLAGTIGLVRGAGAARPLLTEGAAALLGKEPAFLAPEDNTLVPLSPKGKPTPFLQAPVKHLEVLSARPGEALLVIEEDLYRLRGAELSLLTPKVGASPALSTDGKLIVAVEDKKTLKLIAGATARKVPYRRQGRWEFQRPYITPDSSRVLVTIYDFSQPLDVYEFLLVNPVTLESEEIALSQNFIPGPLRQSIGSGQVGLQMFVQETDDNGAVVLREADLVTLDLKTKKLSPAPAVWRPGMASASNRYSLLPGSIYYNDDKSCGGDETRLYEEGKAQPAAFKLGDGTVVSMLDFLPDETGLIASVLDLKKCRARGVIIPIKGDVPPAKWPPFALPARSGHVAGRILSPAAAPPPAAIPPAAVKSTASAPVK